MMRSHLRLPLVLLTGACVVLAGIVALELVKERPSLDSAPVVAPKTVHDGAVSAPARFAMPPLSAFDEIAERPLFSRSRRPTTADDALAPAAQGTGPLILNGVILTGTNKIALLATPEAERMTPLREGETLAGWTLVAVHSDKVVIRNSGDERELLISDTLKMRDSLARRRAEQVREQQIRAQRQLQQERLARRQAAAAGAAAAPATGAPAASAAPSPGPPAEQQQNQEETPGNPEQESDPDKPGDPHG